MTARQPFARRIVIAFVLMTVLVSGAFSAGIVAVVYAIERQLVSDEMHRDLKTIVQQDLNQGRAPRLGPKTQFYAANLAGYAIPERYRRFTEGFTEVDEEEPAYYAYVLDLNGRRYVLIQDQSEFEAREQVLFNVVLAGFICAVLSAWGLGRVLAGKVMAPLSRLARQVQHGDQLQPLAPPLAPDYPDDEVGQLAAAFDATLGKLRQSLERERLFTSDVSHELRTPLMVIATSCELLQQAALGTRQQTQLERIERAAGEMRDLVQTFLQLAREQSDERQLAATSSLAQVAERQCAHWREVISDKGLAFERCDEGADDGRYNPTLLATVMANLLRNAWHYTESGYVRLVLENGGFRVEDSGAGIPADQREAIFEPFVRGAEARGEGLGLGLSLVRRICLQQGWNIAVGNRPAGGSCFRVRLRTSAGSSENPEDPENSALA